MKKLLLVLVAVGFVSVAEEVRHENTPNSVEPEKRPEVNRVKDKTLRLFEFINACMEAPPVAPGNNTPPVGSQTNPSTPTQPSVPTPPPASQNNAGLALFQSKCLSCHSTNGKPIEDKKGVDLLKRFDSNMPPPTSEQAKSLTEADKTALRTYFRNKN